jgi:exopolysaccharide production protein ExoZ
MTRMTRLLGLELLRGVAALLVLQEHLRYAVGNICGPSVELPRLVTHVNGFWGVDIFFVLSGFLIGLTLDRPATTARSFLLARLARVLPLYAVTSAVCLAVPTFRMSPLSPEMIVTTATLLPLTGDGRDPVTAHPYGWTLCYEMLFYLAATTLAAALGGRRALPSLVALFLLGPLAFAAVGPIPGWAFPTFAFSPIAAEFALGIVAYRVAGHVGRRAAWAAFALGVTGLAAAAAFRVPGGYVTDVIAEPTAAAARVLTWGLPAALLVLGVARLEADGATPPSEAGGRLASAAGGVSYSLYLAPPLGVTTPWPAALLTVAVTLALAAAVSRYIDHPLHALARGWAKRLSSPSLPRLPTDQGIPAVSRLAIR